MANDGVGETEVIRCAAEPSSTERLPPETIQALYETHHAELLSFLIGVLRDASAAQDVSQVTFSRLIEVGHTAREETMKGWLFRVALREAIVYRRQNSLQDRHFKKYADQRAALMSCDPDHDSFVKDETVARLVQLLSQLPTDQQYVVRQRIYEGKSFATIAGELNVPLGTVLTRMRIALKKVRKWFD